MNTLRRRLTAAAAGLATMGLVSAHAQPAYVPTDEPLPLLQVQSDCYAIGEAVAQQYGGQLARARPDTQGGQPVCVIVVLVPGKDGQQPRRTEVVVPQG